MMSNTLRAFDALIGRRLDAVRALSPWSSSAHALSPSAAWQFQFGDLTLLCLSPLRLRSSQNGSTYGLDSGDWVSFGFRALLVDRETRSSMLVNAGQWSAWGESGWVRMHPVPPLGHRLTMVQACHTDVDGWVMEFIFDGGAQYHLRYRLDLDGSLEFSELDVRHTIAAIDVLSPRQPFGWLHPAAPIPFVLADCCWTSAALPDWPFHLRRAMGNATNSEQLRRDTLLAAMRARFQQNQHWQRRLEHLAYAVICPDCPSDIYEALRHLRAYEY